MEGRDFWIGTIAFFVIGLLLCGVLPYGAYRYGKFVERRSLHEALMNTMQDTFNAGYFERISHEGIIERWEASHNFQLGYRKAIKDNMEDEDGRY